MPQALYVSVNESYTPGHTTLAELAEAAGYSWRITKRKAEECYCVVAAYKGSALMAWELVMAFKTDEPWDSTGHMARKRTGLVLGPVIPLDPALHPVPVLRNGVATRTVVL